MALKLLIADDHGLVRQSLRHYLELEDDLLVVGEASSGDELINLLETAAEGLLPDVVVLDAGMPEPDGLKAARRIREEHPEVQVVMLSAYDDPEFVVEAFRAGAKGYVLKNRSVQDLVQTLRLVAEGRVVIDPELMPILARGLNPLMGEVLQAPLSTREVEVVQLLAFGNTNKAIAERLSISPDTVKAHLEHAFQKLEVSDRAAAVAGARRRGLID